MITSKVYLALPTSPSELLSNGDFELVTGDNFDDWTEVDQAGTEKLSNGDLELVAGDDFTSWVEDPGTAGAVEDEQVEVHGDTHSAKITCGNTTNYPSLQQTIAATIGKVYKLGAWVKGDWGLSISNGWPDAVTDSGTAADWEYHEISKTSTTTTLYAGANGFDMAVSDVMYVDDLTLKEEYTAVLDEGTTVHGDDHAVKLIGAGVAQGSIYQSGTTTAEYRQKLSFWAYGDGVNGVKYTVYDVTNAAIIKTGYGTTDTDWAQTAYIFYAPVDCVEVKVTIEANGPGPFYLDDVSLLEYDPPTWTLNEDVLASPDLQWGYGIKGSGPMNLVASTGIANMVFDNQEGKYSPENAARVVGFEEGMGVKIVTDMPGVLDPVWSQEFDEELTDFDAVTPAWDAEVNAVASFDSEVDADGDLNNLGATGWNAGSCLAVTFDDANLAYGVINADAVNQTSGVISFNFNYNDVAVEADKYLDIIYALDGASSANWRTRITNEQITIFAKEDDGGYVWGTYVDIPSGWNNYKLMWVRSTGAGNNDGWMRFYINDVLVDSITGLDNDTKDWDAVRAGLVGTSSTTFGGSYYIELIKIDPVGAPMRHTLAVQNGTYGMSIPVMDTTARYVSFADPTAETAVTIECNFDPNSLTMGVGERFYFIYAPELYVALNDIAGVYNIEVYSAEDAGGTWSGSYPITDANHKIRVVWQASSGVGADDGYTKLYIDDVLKETVSGLDNDTKSIDLLSYGAVSGLDAGTYGIFYMDDCKWAPNIGYTKFVGHMTNIYPSAGQYDDPQTECEAQDWIGYLNKQELGIQAIQADKTAAEALTTCLAEFPNQPEDTDFDTGVETFELVFAGDSDTSSMASQFSKLARNEQGRIFCKGDGTLIFEEQGARALNTTSAFTLDGTMTGIVVNYNVGNIYNIVSLKLRTTTTDAAANIVLFKVGKGIKIKAGETLSMTCNFTDPDTGQKCAGADVVDPETADNFHFGSTRTPANDDKHADITWTTSPVIGGSSVAVEMQNTSGALGYLNELTILGKRITEYDSITIEKRDTDSIDQVGNKRYSNRMDLIEDAATVENLVDLILARYAPSHIDTCKITVLANLSDELAGQLIAADPSTRFTAIETVTGISKDFYINAIEYKQDDTLLWVTIEGEEA